MEETPKTLIEGFMQTAQTHQTEVPKRWKHALVRTPTKMPSPVYRTRSATKTKPSQLSDKTPRAMIETYMTNAKTELLSTAKTRRRRSLPAATGSENFTPRTNIAMLIEQGEEETPYTRPQTRRSSRKSLPAIPTSESIHLLPMSPRLKVSIDSSTPKVVEAIHDAIHLLPDSRLKVSIDSSTPKVVEGIHDAIHLLPDSRLKVSIDSSAPKVVEGIHDAIHLLPDSRLKVSIDSSTPKVVEGIHDAIHLLPDSSSGDEAEVTYDKRNQRPVRKSTRSKISPSTQMFDFRTALPDTTTTEKDQTESQVGSQEVEFSSPKSSTLKQIQSEDRTETNNEIDEDVEFRDNMMKEQNMQNNVNTSAEVGGTDFYQSGPENLSTMEAVDSSRISYRNEMLEKSTSLVVTEVIDQGDRGLTTKQMEHVEGHISNEEKEEVNNSTGVEDEEGVDGEGEINTFGPERGVVSEESEDGQGEINISDNGKSAASIDREREPIDQVIEEEGEEGKDGVDFILSEESPSVEQENLISRDINIESEEDTNEETEDVTENYRLAKTPHLYTPSNRQGSDIQPPTDILKNINSTHPLQPINEVLKDARKSTALVKPRERLVKNPQRKRKERPTVPLPVSVMKKVFSHFCKMKVSPDVLPELINVTEKFFRQIPADLEAYCGHAGRKTIDECDVELLMRRQRLINERKSLAVLIEENLPLEYQLQLLPIARAGNIVFPK
ncbi:uncharacterized protein [Argopecten irradians]|uniref:uncharacterized protein n=1 Tax=Argopecten irradians TaxID=31199 RepID=UPI0037161306